MSYALRVRGLRPGLKRSEFARTLAGAAFAFAPRSARAQAPLAVANIRVGCTPQGDVTGVLWSEQSGLMRRSNIQTEIVRLNSGAAIAAALLGGSIEFGNVSMLSLINAHVRGLGLTIELPAAIYTSEVADAIALVVAKESNIQSGRDLNGKTVAVPALGDLFAIGSAAWIDQNGGDSRTVKFLELTARATADAIAAGRVDAATLAQPTLNDSLTSGKCRILGHAYNAIATRFVSTAFTCTTEYAAKNAALVARFRKAAAVGKAYANAHHVEMVPIIAKSTGRRFVSRRQAPFSNRSEVIAC